MKFSSVDWISWAIPGTETESRVRIVRKERSFRSPHMNWMNIDLRSQNEGEKPYSKKFRTIPPGIAATATIPMLYWKASAMSFSVSLI